MFARVVCLAVEESHLEDFTPLVAGRTVELIRRVSGRFPVNGFNLALEKMEVVIIHTD